MVPSSDFLISAGRYYGSDTLEFGKCAKAVRKVESTVGEVQVLTSWIIGKQVLHTSNL